MRIGLNKVYEKFKKYFQYEQRSLYITVLNSEDESNLDKSRLLSSKYSVKTYIKKDQLLKNESKFFSMFQHDQFKAHMATETKELLEECNIIVIEWLPKSAELSLIDL
jgi:hypothetical protein